jgi:sterol desaturase/sphingolipid hydroxylase (fatty acid hydroxylase superfamily)
MPGFSHSVFECRTLAAFNRAFAALPEIQAYAALALGAAVLSAALAQDPKDTLIPVLIVAAGYPAFEYLLHRQLLHGTYLCKTETTARVWWRIHYRHHAEPRDACVILAAPWTLAVAVTTGAFLASSLWWSWSGFAAALAASFFAAILYEYIHSLDHGRVELPNGYLLRMRQHHIVHHYFNEQGNFGIVTPIIDRLVGSVLTPGPARSPTVHNLGYRDELARAYPYIQRIESERGNARAAESP